MGRAAKTGSGKYTDSKGNATKGKGSVNMGGKKTQKGVSFEKEVLGAKAKADARKR